MMFVCVGVGISCVEIYFNIQKFKNDSLSRDNNVIDNNVAFLQVLTQTSLCSLRLSLDTPMMSGQ